MRLADHFERAATAHPDRIAFEGAGQSLTYRQARESAERIAAALYARGLGSAHIAVLSPNHPQAFCCLLGLFRAGGCWLPVNVRSPVRANAALLQRMGCQVLFFHGSQEEQAVQLVREVPSICCAVRIGGADQAGEALELAGFIAGDFPDAPWPQDDPDRLETLFPTGGTTGLPKAARWTQRTWAAGISAFWTCMPCAEPPVHLLVAPMTHGAGMMALFMLPMAPTQVTLQSADPESVIDAIARHRPTHLYLPPTVIYSILAHADVRDADFSSLRYLVTAGAPIAPEKLREAMDVFGPVMCQSFGQAEAPMFLAHLHTRDLLEAAGDFPGRWASCGRPPFGVSVRTEVMSENGVLLGPRQTGEVVARGDLVCAGYHGDAGEGTPDDGWHHTGDLGWKDEAGFLYIVDRKKDMIVTGGFNVYSVHVEQVLLAHAAVQDCAVVGVPHDKWGEAVLAVVQLKPGMAVTEEELVAAVKKELGGVHAPKQVIFSPSLPRSPNGKVLKREIRAPYWAQHGRAVG